MAVEQDEAGDVVPAEAVVGVEEEAWVVEERNSGVGKQWKFR